MPRKRRWLGNLVLIAALAVAAAWALGAVLRDRFGWSQYLFWTPSAIVAALNAVAAIVLLALRRPRGAAAVGATALLLGLHAGLVQNRPLTPAPHLPAGALSLLHCNLLWPGRVASPDVAAFAASRPEDIVVFSEPGWLLAQNRGLALEQAGWNVARIGRYALLTRLPIIEHRPLVSRPTVDVTLVRLDASSRGLGELTMALVDLPSNPSIPRTEVARSVRELLDEVGAPPFDLVVGDMNVTRGSASMTVLFPGMHEAWSDAGRGWGGSFPAWLPFWHIDHVLLAPRLRAADYTLVDTGFSRHRAQSAVIVPR